MSGAASQGRYVRSATDDTCQTARVQKEAPGLEGRSVPADGDYAKSVTPDWRDREWSRHEHDAVVAGRRLHYLDVGTGDRVFVLIHGMGGRWQYWLENVPALAEHGRVLALDLPGFGRSQPPAEPVTLEGLADVAAELVRSLGIGRAVFVGHSLGGQVALRVGGRHPDLAEAVVSVGGAIYQFGDVLARRGVLRLAFTRPRETASIVAEILTAGVRPPGRLRRWIASSSLLRRVFLAPYVLHPAALAADTAALIIDGAGAAGVYPTARAVARSNLIAGTRGATCPVLSLAADCDRITPLRDTGTLQRELPHAHTVVLEGCGHMLMLERPRAFNAELVSFAAELPTPPKTTGPK